MCRHVCMDMSPKTRGIGMCIDMCVDVERLRTELRNAKDLAETLGPKLVRCQIIDARRRVPHQFPNLLMHGEGGPKGLANY